MIMIMIKFKLSLLFGSLVSFGLVVCIVLHGVLCKSKKCMSQYVEQQKVLMPAASLMLNSAQRSPRQLQLR